MFARRFWTARIEAAWQQRSLVWLAGVRRAGKTMLCQGLQDIEYLDCELPSVRRSLEDPELFLRSRSGRRIVLDEVHRLNNPSEVLKIATDHFPSVRVIATGSSTLQASTKFRDTLTGRKVEVWLTPMMSADLADFGSDDLVRRLRNGGLPERFLADQALESDFQEWVDSYWAKDIQELFRLERRSSFTKFIELILARSGGVFEATAFAEACEVSRPTIANYLGVLESTHVAHVVRPYSTRRTTEIVAAPKVYGFDTGFVSAFRGWRELRPDDLGVLWEHYVLNELHARAVRGDIRYWRSTRHHELDFAVLMKGHPPLAVECKWSADGREDLSGMRAFRRRYPKGRNVVVAANVKTAYARRIGELVVEFVNLNDFMALVAASS